MLCNLFSRHIFVSVVMLFRNFHLCFVYCKVRNFYLFFCMRVCKYGIDFVHSFVPINTFNHHMSQHDYFCYTGLAN